MAGVALSMGMASPAQGQSPEPLVTDRPDATESTVTVAPGFVQLEFGWTVSEITEERTEERTHTAPELLARIGLVPRVELRIGVASWMFVRETAEAESDRDNGIGDTEVGFKLRLADSRGVFPAIALLGALSLPTGDRGFSSERADPSFRFAFSHDIGERVAVGYNVGAVWVSEEEAVSGAESDRQSRDLQGDLLYTITVGVGLTHRLGAFVEAFGFTALESERSDRQALDGGLTLLLAPNLQLDVRVGVGLDSDAEDWFTGLGLSVRLPG